MTDKTGERRRAKEEIRRSLREDPTYDQLLDEADQLYVASLYPDPRDEYEEDLKKEMEEEGYLYRMTDHGLILENTSSYYDPRDFEDDYLDIDYSSLETSLLDRHAQENNNGKLQARGRFAPRSQPRRRVR
jgi:hypothetical protein